MCDLCTDNLKIFSNERKYYTRKELARHRKTGDPDETSYRGHPLCKFCDVRFVDEDDLHSHLRREHFYCHFCDPSGLNHFYGDYSALRDHFLADHYLCKECDCQEEKFTCAFRSEIDLQAHIAQLHSQNMSKSDLKKAKTLSLDIFIRQRSHLPIDSQNRRKKDNRSRNNDSNAIDETDSELNLANSETASNNTNLVQTQPPRPEDFPQLGSNAPNVTNTVTENNTDVKVPKNNSRKQNTFSVCLNKNPNLNTRNDEEFPALPSSNSSSNSKDSKINVSNSIAYNKFAKQKPNVSNGLKSQTVALQVSQQTKPNNSSTDASLPLKSGPQIPKPAKNKPIISSKEEFPSLPVPKKKSSTRNSAQNATINHLVSNNSKKDNSLEWNNSSHLENKNVKNEIKQNIPQSKSYLKSLSNFEEFPVLEERKAKTPNIQHLTQLSKAKTMPKNPPPGLTAIRKKSANLSLSSVAQEVISNPSTDSNSIDYSNTDEYCYINPIDFNERNQSLVREVENVLGDHSKFCIFKDTSKEFRQGIINGDQYYEKCIELFGKKGFATIFSELLVLLPDIQKQNELLAAQQNELKNTKGAIPKGFKIITDFNSNEFIICPKCKQVLIIKDQINHMSQH